jgi:hypothetical protein
VRHVTDNTAPLWELQVPFLSAELLKRRV